jgi:hypothetical protein
MGTSKRTRRRRRGPAEQWRSRRPSAHAGRGLGAIIIVALSLAAAGCGGDVEPIDAPSTAEVEAPIYGDTTITTDMVASGPKAAVGRLLPSGCSAVAISRTAVITARHCTCNISDGAPGQTFCLPQGSASPGGCMTVSSGGFMVGTTQVFNHGSAFDICNPNVGLMDDDGTIIAGTEAVIADVSVIRLAAPIPTTILPTIPKVLFTYTPPETMSAEFFHSGFGGNAYKSNVGTGTRRWGRTGDNIGYESDSSDFVGIAIEADADDDAPWSSTSFGDSGGALFAKPANGTLDDAFLIGVVHGYYLDINDYQIYAPTQDLEILSPIDDGAITTNGNLIRVRRAAEGRRTGSTATTPTSWTPTATAWATPAITARSPTRARSTRTATSAETSATCAR